MKKFLAVILFICLSASVVSAQSDTETSKKRVTLSGKILQKAWSKSQQSYCAQGSDYFVLSVTGKGSEFVLENSSKQNLSSLLGKTVKVEGYHRRKTVKSNPDENMQRPVNFDGSDDFVCEVFVVEKIMPSENSKKSVPRKK
jgi:uncharacterized protein YutD